MSEDALFEKAAAVDGFLETLFVNDDRVMQDVLRRSDEAGLPTYAVTPMYGLFLHILAAAIGAKRILEIGALGGYSTIWLARALPEDGRVVTLDIDPVSIKTTRANAEMAGLGDKIDAIEGPANETLAKMQKEGGALFDFIFIDADKAAYPAYFDLCRPLIRRGGLIVADNVVRQGALADLETPRVAVKGVRAYLEKAKADPGLRTSVLQTISAKDYDGFAVSLAI